MAEPVIFLDFDGVICSPRAFIAQEIRWSDRRALRWADQVACDMVYRLLVKFQARLVISSTWRNMVDECNKVLGHYGLSPFLHDDWRTGNDDKRHRGTEIAAWLDKNGNPPFIILDDDSDMTEAQTPWLVLTDSLNGMMLHDFTKAEELLAAISQEPTP